MFNCHIWLPEGILYLTKIQKIWGTAEGHRVHVRRAESGLHPPIALLQGRVSNSRVWNHERETQENSCALIFHSVSHSCPPFTVVFHSGPFLQMSRWTMMDPFIGRDATYPITRAFSKQRIWDSEMIVDIDVPNSYWLVDENRGVFFHTPLAHNRQMMMPMVYQSSGPSTYFSQKDMKLIVEGYTCWPMLGPIPTALQKGISSQTILLYIWYVQKL